MVDGKMKHAFSIEIEPKKHVLSEGALSELDGLSMVERSAGGAIDEVSSHL